MEKGSYFRRHSKSYLRCRGIEPRLIFCSQGAQFNYVKQLQIHGIKEKVHTTHFTEGLVKGLPESHIETINNKTRVFFKCKVKELIDEHVKCPDDFLFSI